MSWVCNFVALKVKLVKITPVPIIRRLINYELWGQ